MQGSSTLEAARVVRLGVLLVWFAWAAWVASRYYTIPAELVAAVDAVPHVLPFWREALWRAARGLAGAAATVLAGWAAGRFILSAARSRNLFAGTMERAAVRLTLGLAAVSVLLLGLAGLGLYRPVVVSIAIAILASAGAYDIARAARAHWFAFALRSSRHDASKASLRRDRLGSDGAASWICGAVGLAAVGVAFVAALAPEIEFDALWYHLWLPQKWLEAGGSVDIVEEYVSLYPLGWDLLYGSAMALGGPVGAKLLHFTCLPLSGVATVLLSRVLFPGTSGTIAAAIAITAPIVLWEATTAYVDLALACYLTLSLHAVVRHHASGDRRWLLVAAMLGGFALSIKHLALVGIAVLTAAVLLLERLRSQHSMSAARAALLFLAIAVLPAAPWYARAYAASGNPVFPDLFRVFGSTPAARWSAASESALAAFKERFGRERTAVNVAMLPWDLTVNASRYGGTVGPLFVLLIPAALLWRRQRRTAWALAAGCAAYLGIWASPLSSYQMRFVVPLVPAASVLAAHGAAAVLEAARTWRAAAAVTAVVGGMLAFNLPPVIEWHENDRVGWAGWLTHVVRRVPLAVVVGGESGRDYLARAVPSYRAWEHIDAALPERSLVLTFSDGDHLYSARRRLWSDATAARPATWDRRAGQEDEALHALHALGVTHVLLDLRRLENDPWLPSLALVSPATRRCCLRKTYEDERFALFRIVAYRLTATAE